jgi:hypothetical protein
VIECKDILSLCDRFEAYLIPLDIHILRQRYNGKVLKSTYAVAHDMGLAAETVREIENRALEALAHCRDLEADGREIVPMRLAKSFRQPVASMLGSGELSSTSVAGYTAQRGELLIFASSLDPDDGSESLLLGTIVGRVLIVDCVKRDVIVAMPHAWTLRFDLT